MTRGKMIDDNSIFIYVSDFKEALIHARDEGAFDWDHSFLRFPKACCGDTSYILAEYLRLKGIETIYVWGDYRGQTHAWLVVKDGRIKSPQERRLSIPHSVVEALSLYGNQDVPENMTYLNYSEKDIDGGLIIDITADQFGEDSVYVNYLDTFHRKFKFQNAHDYVCLVNSRLYRLFEIVLEYLGDSYER